MPDQRKRQEEWVEAQRRCRLTDEHVRRAKELGIGPRSIIKNIPNGREPWKAPVAEWIDELYCRMLRKQARKQSG